MVTPALLWLFLGASKEMPFLDAAQKLALNVVLPTVAGHLLHRLLGRRGDRANGAASLVAHLLLMWIIAVVVATSRERIASANATLYLAVLALNLLGYAAGLAGASALRLPRPMARALVLEVGMQNAGVGAYLASELVSPAAAALYAFVCMFTGGILAAWWSGRSIASPLEAPSD